MGREVSWGVVCMAGRWVVVDRYMAGSFTILSVCAWVSLRKLAI